MVKQLRPVTPWAKRLPRKPYNRTKRDEKACQAVPAPRLDIARLSRRQAAAAPAKESTAAAPIQERKDRRQLPQCQWAVRLTKGRTVDTLLQLLQTRLLATCGLDEGAALRPQAGLSCQNRFGQESFILATFQCRGALLADVVEILEGSPLTARPDDVITVAQDSLSAVGFRHRLMSATKAVLRFEAVCPATDPAAVLPDMAPLRATLSTFQRSSEASPLDRHEYPHTAQAPLQVLPAGARDHTAQHGPQHRTCALSQKQKWGILLDVPHCRLLNIAPHRCKACGPQRAEPGAKAYFGIQPRDIVEALQAEMPCRRVRVLRRARKPLYFTDQFLRWLLQEVYASFNMRQVRRNLFTVVAASLMHTRPVGAHIVLTSLPCRRELQLLAANSFLRHLKRRVDIMRRSLQLYSGQGLRQDGHFKLPKRLVTRRQCKDGKRRLKHGEYKVLIAFTGIDGALLAPVHVAATESFADVRAALEPYLQELQATRLNAGHSLLESLPSFHTTDNFRRDSGDLRKLYKSIWKGLAVTPKAGQPKSVALGADMQEWKEDWFTVSGDPEHDCIAFKKCISKKAVGRQAAVADHCDCLHRLAAPLPPSESAAQDEVQVPPEAHSLLAAALEKSAADFKAEAVQSAHRETVLAFLKQPRDWQLPTWQACCGKAPSARQIRRARGRTANACASIQDPLLPEVRSILAKSVDMPKTAFQKMLQDVDAATVQDLLSFLERRQEDQVAEWKAACGMMPPRGVISRLHRRTAKELDANSALHPSLGFFNFTSLPAFRAELARLQRWYSRRATAENKGKKDKKGRRRPRVWNKKTQAHYRRLRKGLRLQGFWESRRISLWMAEAGLTRQTGTVPTERLWSQLLAFFPRESRRLSLPFFHLLSCMAFIRFNLRHLGKSAAPIWTDRDVLLSEQFESFMDCWFRQGESELPEDLVQDLLELYPEL